MSALAAKILELDRAHPGDPAAAFEMTGPEWAELLALARGDAPVAPKPFRIAILACSKSKLSEAAPAQDLYTGELFKASLAAARKLADRFVILSAKHGVVQADEMLEPYDESIASKLKHQKAQWGARVADQLRREFWAAQGELVLCLAPGSYIECIGHLAGKRDWTMPLKGLGIGQQKAKLKELGGAA